MWRAAAHRGAAYLQRRHRVAQAAGGVRDHDTAATHRLQLRDAARLELRRHQEGVGGEQRQADLLVADAGGYRAGVVLHQRTHPGRELLGALVVRGDRSPEDRLYAQVAKHPLRSIEQDLEPLLVADAVDHHVQHLIRVDGQAVLELRDQLGAHAQHLVAPRRIAEARRLAAVRQQLGKPPLQFVTQLAVGFDALLQARRVPLLQPRPGQALRHCTAKVLADAVVDPDHGVQQRFQTVAVLLDLPGVGGAHGEYLVREADAGRHQIEQCVVARVGEPGRELDGKVEQAEQVGALFVAVVAVEVLPAAIVDDVHETGVGEGGAAGVVGVAAHDAAHQAGGRVVGGHHLRVNPEADHHLGGRPPQSQPAADALVGAVAPIQAVEQVVMVEQEVGHPLHHPAVHAYLEVFVAKLKVHGHAGVGHAEPRHRVPHLGHRPCVPVAVQRRDHVHRLAETGQLAGQFEGHVGQTAALGERLRLRRHEYHRPAAQQLEGARQHPAGARRRRQRAAVQVSQAGAGAGARAHLAVGVVQGTLQPDGDRFVGGRVVQRQQGLIEKPQQPVAARRGVRQRPVGEGGRDLVAGTGRQQPVEGIAQQLARGGVRAGQIDAQQLYPLPVAHRRSQRCHAQLASRVVRVAARHRRVGGVDHHVARRLVDRLRRAQIGAHGGAVGGETAHRQPQAARRRLDCRRHLLVVGRHQGAAPRVAAVECVHLAEHPLHAAIRRTVETVPVDVHVVGEHLPRFAVGVALVVQQQIGQERGQRQHRTQVVASEGVHRAPFVVVAEHAHQLGAGRQRVPVVVLVQVVDLAHRRGALRDPLADLEQRGVVGHHPEPAQVLFAAPVGFGEEQRERLAGAAGGLLQFAHQQVVQRTGDQIAARGIEEAGGDVVVVLALVDHDGALHLVLVGARPRGQGGGVVALHHRCAYGRGCRERSAVPTRRAGRV